MSYTDWKEKTEGFKKIDVRGVAGNFLEGLKKQAAALPAGNGMEVIQLGDRPVSAFPGVQDHQADGETGKRERRNKHSVEGKIC